jgi:probable poly-beta-1,6-N-acetyl-D-glucosamine export protein
MRHNPDALQTSVYFLFPKIFNFLIMSAMRRELTDFAKVVAAIAVVGIHATSTSENNFAAKHDFFSADFLSVLLNQWARFSVPLFLFLSAYGLALSDKNQGEKLRTRYSFFLMKRLPTILIPYLFFSALGFALNFQNLTPWVIIDTLRKGGGDYHLYFLVILLQCYLLFPLLLWLCERSAKSFRMLAVLAFLLVVFFLYKTTSERTLGFLGLSHPGWHASFCVYWLPYFMLGILHAKAPPAPWGMFTAVAAVLLALVLVLHDYFYYSQQGTPVDYYNHFSRPSVALYALAVIYLLHAVAERRMQSFGKVAPLAGLTFTVYLVHPQILRLLNWQLPGLQTLLIWALTVLIAFNAVFTTKKLLGKFENPLVNFLQRALGLR